jgi:hypothetical protein
MAAIIVGVGGSRFDTEKSVMEPFFQVESASSPSNMGAGSY